MIAKEIERAGVPVAFITAMSSLGQQIGAKRVITGVRVPHPVGQPGASDEEDINIRREILKTAIESLAEEITEPTIFQPNIKVI